jgi:uncharacterized protein (TIGR00251 family)
MKISVKVKPGVRETAVESTGEGTYAVSVTVPAKEGKANEALVAALAAHFGVAPSRIRVVSGHTARRKIVEVL